MVIKIKLTIASSIVQNTRPAAHWHPGGQAKVKDL